MKHRVYNPDYAVHPRHTVRETMTVLGIGVEDLASRSGLSLKTVKLILKGAKPIDDAVAAGLERATRIPRNVWLNLQRNYEKH
ncbi:MAG: hypothetical protein KatS3mg105_3312 [Gemmatales bacterium]|nr:MAG: hypothetical protein KatS3mg105_3312 [Gemmatales bacterium]